MKTKAQPRTLVVNIYEERRTMTRDETPPMPGMLKRALRKGGTARTTAAKGGDEVPGTDEGLSDTTCQGDLSLERVHVDTEVASLVVKNSRKAFQMKHAVANAPARQTAERQTSETTPIRLIRTTMEAHREWQRGRGPATLMQQTLTTNNG